MTEREIFALANKLAGCHGVTTEGDPPEKIESSAWWTFDEQDLLKFSQGIRRAALEEWQPIDTAPKDGTVLILFARAKHATASAPVFGWWLPDLGWVESAFSPNHPVGIIPSHWMPRPAFPSGGLTSP